MAAPLCFPKKCRFAFSLVLLAHYRIDQKGVKPRGSRPGFAKPQVTAIQKLTIAWRVFLGASDSQKAHIASETNPTRRDLFIFRRFTTVRAEVREGNWLERVTRV